MSEPMKLETTGHDCPEPTPEEKQRRIDVMVATLKEYAPEVVEGVRQQVNSPRRNRQPLIMHQDAFAATYNADEYLLLGMAVKYAGFCGVDILFIGRNGETYK